jgi:hypothetical protein
MSFVLLFFASTVTSLYQLKFAAGSKYNKTELAFDLGEKEVEEACDDQVKSFPASRKDCQTNDYAHRALCPVPQLPHYPDSPTQPPGSV